MQLPYDGRRRRLTYTLDRCILNITIVSGTIFIAHSKMRHTGHLRSICLSSDKAHNGTYERSVRDNSRWNHPKLESTGATVRQTQNAHHLLAQ